MKLLWLALAAGMAAGCGIDADPPPPPTLRPDGFGAVRTGMSLAEASDAVTQRLPVRQDDTGCRMIQPHALPTGVSLMIEHDTVVRVDVETTLASTDSGARVGMSEDSLRAIYHGRLRAQPHKDNPAPWRYLIFEPAGDTLHRIVFESDGQRVRSMRGGARPAVEYTEKCG